VAEPALAVLLGADHPDLGEIATAAPTPRVAAALSRGRFPKGYPALDPNEDAVLVADADRLLVAVVADGHRGFDAARCVIDAAAGVLTRDPNPDPVGLVGQVLTAAVTALDATLPTLEPPRSASRTALSVAAVAGDRLVVATAGDTACFVVAGRSVRPVGEPHEFLGTGASPDEIPLVEAPLSAGAAVVVTSDGFTDFTIRTAPRVLRQVPALMPKAAAKMLVDAAFAGGAGDNVAVAVLRP